MPPLFSHSFMDKTIKCRIIQFLQVGQKLILLKTTAKKLPAPQPIIAIPD